jgi:hypothetical protein
MKSIPAVALLWVSMPVQLLVPLYTYYVAVSQGEVKPFPDCTITSTASHHPQAVVFRLAFMANACVMPLIFWLINLTLHRVAARIHYPGEVSGWVTKVGLCMAFCYALTIGTIDTGRHGKIHGINAVIFFVLLLVVMVSTTLTLHRMRQWDVSAVSGPSWAIKCLACGAVLGTWLLELTVMATRLQSHDDPQVDIVEWVSNYGALVWLSSFYYEFKSLRLVIQ